MVRRAEPLIVDIFVTALAGVGLHEELAGNFPLAINLRGTGEERTLGAVAFAVHVVGRHRGILNTRTRLPAFADVAGAVSDTCQEAQTNCRAQEVASGIRG